MTYIKAKQALKTMAKDSVSMLSNFDGASKLFNKSEMNRLTNREKIDVVYVDYELIPLLVFENYLAASDQKYLKDMAEAAESMAFADVINKEIRQNNN